MQKPDLSNIVEKNFIFLAYFEYNRRNGSEIFREEYLEKIKPYLGKKIIKAIVGMRRSGKSYFLKQLQDYLYKNGLKKEMFLMIDMEEIKTDFIHGYKDLVQYVDKYFEGKKGRRVLFIDEIQEIEGWEKAIRSYLKEDYEIVVTGSNALIGYKAEDIAGMLENVVYLELRRRGYRVNIGQYESAEIDFVAALNGKLLYVQVCYLLETKKVIDREFNVLLEIKDNFPKYVISLDEVFREDNQGVKSINIRDFLLTTAL